MPSSFGSGEALRPRVQVLFELGAALDDLAVSWMVIGGAALEVYRVSTQDHVATLMVDLTPPVPASLRLGSQTLVVEAVRAETREVFHRRQRVTVAEGSLWVIGPEDLALQRLSESPLTATTRAEVRWLLQHVSLDLLTLLRRADHAGLGDLVRELAK